VTDPADRATGAQTWHRRRVDETVCQFQGGLNVIGMASVTGLPETWLVEAHYSFASVRIWTADRALAPVRAFSDASDPLQDDVLAPSRTMLTQYRANWSYRPDQAIRMFRRRAISRFPCSASGRHGGMFGELIRLRRASADVVNLDRRNWPTR